MAHPTHKVSLIIICQHSMLAWSFILVSTGYGSQMGGLSGTGRPLLPKPAADSWLPSSQSAIPNLAINGQVVSSSSQVTSNDRAVVTTSHLPSDGRAFSGQLLPQFSSGGRLSGPTLISQSISGGGIGSQSIPHDINHQLPPQEYSTGQHSMP